MTLSPIEKEKIINALESIANSLKRIADAITTSEAHPLDPELKDDADVLKAIQLLDKEDKRPSSPKESQAEQHLPPHKKQTNL